jgi:hypothetical protein
MTHSIYSRVDQRLHRPTQRSRNQADSPQCDGGILSSTESRLAALLGLSLLFNDAAEPIAMRCMPEGSVA